MATPTSRPSLTSTRTSPGVYTVSVGGHSFLVMKDGPRSWGIEGLDNRTDEMVCVGVYHGTAYAAAQAIVDTTTRRYTHSSAHRSLRAAKSFLVNATA